MANVPASVRARPSRSRPRRSGTENLAGEPGGKGWGRNAVSQGCSRCLGGRAAPGGLGGQAVPRGLSQPEGSGPCAPCGGVDTSGFPARAGASPGRSGVIPSTPHLELLGKQAGPPSPLRPAAQRLAPSSGASGLGNFPAGRRAGVLPGRTPQGGRAPGRVRWVTGGGVCVCVCFGEVVLTPGSRKYSRFWYLEGARECELEFQPGPERARRCGRRDPAPSPG